MWKTEKQLEEIFREINLNVGEKFKCFPGIFVESEIPQEFRENSL